MENKTLTALDPNMEFTIGSLVAPVNWEVSVFVDDLDEDMILQLEKNFNPNAAGTPDWRATSVNDQMAEDGAYVFRLVGGGHFRISPIEGDPTAVFVSLSF